MRNSAQRWWTLSGDELAGAVTSLCNGLKQTDSLRRDKYNRLLSLYEGRPVDINSDHFFVDVPKDFIAPLYNVSRSACDTAQADIAGRQKPKPMFMTTGAEWKVRRRAKKLDKFVEAQLHLPQAQYANGWEVMLEVFHDATKVGVGIAKVWGDIEHKQIRIDRVFGAELFVDLRDARYGNPQNLFHIYSMERDIVEDVFCNVEGDVEGNERRRAAIQSAKSARPDSARVVESVEICEAWRLPFGEGKPGKHAICVDGATLFEEDWEREDFPFLIYRWNHDSVGFWGTGIIEEGEMQQAQIDDTAMRLSERIRICAERVTYYNPQTTKLEDLEGGGEAERFIAVNDMSQAPMTPPPQPASSAEFQWLDENISRYYETRGVSQMTANSQKPPGVDAAVAMQTLNDIQTVRFLPKARAYETAFITLGKLICYAAKDIAEAHGGYLVRWPGKRFLVEFDWNDVSLEEDMYQIRVASVSQFSRDPGAILELAQELWSSQVITRETFLSMVELPDFEGVLNNETAETEYIDDLLDRYLDAVNDSELEELGGFESPEPFIGNVAAVTARCVATYWEAKRDRAPEYCLDLIRRFITELQPKPPPAQPAASPAAAGAPPMPPGMPMPPELASAPIPMPTAA